MSRPHSISASARATQRRRHVEYRVFGEKLRSISSEAYRDPKGVDEESFEFIKSVSPVLIYTAAVVNPNTALKTWVIAVKYYQR